MPKEQTKTDFAKPIVDFIRRAADGRPYLSGSRCRSCGYTYVGQREVCARCFARGAMDEIELADSGRLYVWSIIHRSFPGIKTPFIDAVVDLVDGAHLKGILRGVAPDPESIGFDMSVRVVFDEVVPVGQEVPYLSYFFEPA